MKLIETPLTPLDRMFRGRPISYAPGSTKRTPPDPKPEANQGEPENGSPPTAPVEPGERST